MGGTGGMSLRWGGGGNDLRREWDATFATNIMSTSKASYPNRALLTSCLRSTGGRDYLWLVLVAVKEGDGFNMFLRWLYTPPLEGPLQGCNFFIVKLINIDNFNGIMRPAALRDGSLTHCRKETLQYGGHSGRRWNVVDVAVELLEGGFEVDKRRTKQGQCAKWGFAASAWQRATAINHVTLSLSTLSRG